MAQISFINETVTDGTHHISDTGVYGTWEKSTSDGGIATLISATVDPTTTNATVVSPGIPGVMAQNRKIRIGFNTTTAGADVATDFGIEGSYNGKDWILVSEEDADVDPQTTGIQEHEVDLTDKYYPWLRLVWNDGDGAGGSLTDFTTWQGYFFVSGLDADGINLPLGESAVGGVGPDPS